VFFLGRLRGRADSGVFIIGLPIERYNCGGEVAAYRKRPFLESQQKSEKPLEFISKFFSKIPRSRIKPKIFKAFWTVLEVFYTLFAAPSHPTSHPPGFEWACNTCGLEPNNRKLWL
jgi:hypothetical protein